MHEPTYRDALKVGWQLSWHNKSLWVFGLFAAFLGQMGIVEILMKTGFAAYGTQGLSVWAYVSALFSNPSQLKSFFDVPFDQLVTVLWLCVLLGTLTLGFVVVAVISQGVLVHEAARHVKHKRALERASSWDQGVTHFWRLFGINAAKKIVTIVMMIIVGWGTVNALLNPTVFDDLLFLIIFLLAVFVGMVASILVVYAAGYIVIENYTLGKALEGAWQLFKKHWLVSLEVGFIFVVLNIILFVVALFSIYLFALVVALFWIVALAFNSAAIISTGVFVGILFCGMFIMLVGSIFSVLTTSSWTYLFMKMHKEGLKSRILHWLRGGV